MWGLKNLGEGRKNSIRKKLGKEAWKCKANQNMLQIQKTLFLSYFKKHNSWSVVCGSGVPAFIHLQNCVPGHLCVPVPTATTTSSRVSHQPNPSPLLIFISCKKMGLFFQLSYWRSKPHTGVFTCVEYLPGAVLCCRVLLEQCTWWCSRGFVLLQGGMCLPWLCVLICPSLPKMWVHYLKTRLLKLASNSVLSA